VGAAGTAYLVLKIGRDGRVADAVAEQVNLRVVASEKNMARLRKLFAGAALAGAKKWTFNPPTIGEEADDPYWSVRVPVAFFTDHLQLPKDTEWHSYVPGPRNPIPWRSEQPTDSPDALAAGGVYPLDNNGPRLLTPLGGS
jgi:hypothetical protein